MARLDSFRATAGVLAGTVLSFLVFWLTSHITWEYSTGCAKSTGEPPSLSEYTEDELESLRGKPVHTSSWSWFYTPTTFSGFHQGFPFFRNVTMGWPMTFLEKTSFAEGCFAPWVIHTEWHVGGLLVDGVVSAGFGALLFWLLRRGLSWLRAHKE